MSDPFSPVIGHAQICELLRRVLPHPGNAYLFFGPARVGKRLVAERFAAALLDYPFDRSLEGHPDFFRMKRGDESKEIVIKQARELIQRVSLSAGRGGRMVVLIKEADFLNEEAANALLKIVEEPARHVTYLFLAERAERLPATLRSRMALVPFERVSPQLIIPWLRELGAEAKQAEEVATWAHGCPGLAKYLLESRREFEIERQRAKKFVEGMMSASLGARLALIEEVSQSIDHGDEPERCWRQFLQLCMQTQLTLLETNPQMASRVGAGLIHAWKMVGSSLSPRFALEWCGVQSNLNPRSFPSFLHPITL